jgi:hypothetical protein
MGANLLTRRGARVPWVPSQDGYAAPTLADVTAEKNPDYLAAIAQAVTEFGDALSSPS